MDEACFFRLFDLWPVNEDDRCDRQDVHDGVPQAQIHIAHIAPGFTIKTIIGGLVCFGSKVEIVEYIEYQPGD